MHWKVQVSSLLSEDNHSYEMSLIPVNLLLWLFHRLITSNPHQCLLGTQMTTIQNLAYLDSNRLFSDVGPCFFSTRMIRFITILVLIPFPQIPWFYVRQLIYYKAQCEYLFSPPSLTHTPFPCVLVEKFCSLQVPSSSTPTNHSTLFVEIPLHWELKPTTFIVWAIQAGYLILSDLQWYFSL